MMEPYREFYERLAHKKGDTAPHYQQYYAPARRLEETVSLVRGRSFDRVLDVGCGDGVLLNRVKASLQSEGRLARFVAVDISGMRLERTRQRVGADVCTTDAANLPFRDEAFELALCTEVIEHLPDPKATIGELARVAERGGVVIISVPVAGWYHTLLAKLGRRVAYLEEDEHLREYSLFRLDRFERIADLLAALRAVGLQVVRVRGAYFWRGEEKLRLNQAYAEGRSFIKGLSLLDRLLGCLPVVQCLGRYLILELRKG